jgi:hypothetical protein
MTHGRVARTADEDRQPSVELLEQRLRSKRVASRGGELDRERDPLETDADLGDG